jgi:hypothetical protein
VPSKNDPGNGTVGGEYACQQPSSVLRELAPGPYIVMSIIVPNISPEVPAEDSVDRGKLGYRSAGVLNLPLISYSKINTEFTHTSGDVDQLKEVEGCKRSICNGGYETCGGWKCETRYLKRQIFYPAAHGKNALAPTPPRRQLQGYSDRCCKRNGHVHMPAAKLAILSL